MNRTVKSVHESKTSQTRSLSRLVSLSNQSKGNLYLTVISAPDAEAREKVSHHLRYWPYVKFFKYQGDRHLLVCFCLGEAKDGYQLKQLFERSRQLILLCLRQYDVTITRWKPLPEDFKLFRNRPLFTRPDSNLKPFITFMGEQDSSDSAKVIPHPSSLSSGRPDVLKISQKSESKSLNVPQFFHVMTVILKNSIRVIRKKISNS